LNPLAPKSKKPSQHLITLFLVIVPAAELQLLVNLEMRLGVLLQDWGIGESTLADRIVEDKHSEFRLIVVQVEGILVMSLQCLTMNVNELVSPSPLRPQSHSEH
jgi:hypothetical protein